MKRNASKPILSVTVAAIVVIAFVVAPSVVGSSATLNLSVPEPAASLDGYGESLAVIGIDVQKTTAAPIEPMAGYY